MSAVTKEFLGSPDTWREAKIELDEIDDVWGGKRITIYGDGTAFVKIVDLAHIAETYRLELEQDQAPDLFTAMLDSDVLAVDGEQADEYDVCALLTITNAAGEVRSVRIWELAPNRERFDDVRNQLSAIHERMADLGARLVATANLAAAEELPAAVSDGAADGAAELTSEAAEAAKAAELSLPQSAPDSERSPLRALNAIAQFFTSDGWSFEQMPERPILRLPFQGKGGRWNCYAQVRVTRDVEQVLFYSVLPLNVPVEKRSAIAEFITRANYGMALGNFELDFNDGEVRYKTSLDVTDADIPASLLRPLVYTNVLMMDKYMAGLVAVVYADVPPEEAVKQIEG